MIRGTTPTFCLKMNRRIDGYEEISVAFSQKHSLVLEKATKDCHVDGNYLVIGLSQEETLRFSSGIPTSIQVRVRFNEMNAIASNVIMIDTKKILREGVL